MKFCKATKKACPYHVNMLNATMAADIPPRSASKKTAPLSARKRRSLSAAERRELEYENLLDWLQRVAESKQLQKRPSIRKELLEHYEVLYKQNDPAKKEAMNRATQALIAIVTGTVIMPFERKAPVMTCDFLMGKIADTSKNCALDVRVDALAAVDWRRYDGYRSPGNKKADTCAIETLFKTVFTDIGPSGAAREKAQAQQQKAFAAIEAPLQRKMDNRKQKWIGDDDAALVLLAYPVAHAIDLALQAQALSFSYAYIEKKIKESDEALIHFKRLSKAACVQWPIETAYLNKKIALLRMQQELKKECAACVTLLQAPESSMERNQAEQRQQTLVQGTHNFYVLRTKFDTEIETPALFTDYVQLCSQGAFKP